MRFVLYNIRYATGTGAAFHLPVPGAGYLRSNPRVLEGITRFIKSRDPDIVGLIEVDTGSIRTGLVNQAQVIAKSLGHYSTYQCKYGTSSINTMVPIVRKQANAFLASPRVEGERFHSFPTRRSSDLGSARARRAVRVPGASLGEVPSSSRPTASPLRADPALDQAGNRGG